MTSPAEKNIGSLPDGWEVTDDAYPGLGYGGSYAVRVRKAAKAVLRVVPYDGTESAEARAPAAADPGIQEWVQRQGE